MLYMIRILKNVMMVEILKEKNHNMKANFNLPFKKHDASKNIIFTFKTLKKIPNDEELWFQKERDIYNVFCSTF